MTEEEKKKNEHIFMKNLYTPFSIIYICVVQLFARTQSNKLEQDKKHKKKKM